MCQIEEFNLHIHHQVEDEKNQELSQEQREEKHLEEEEESENNGKQEEIFQKSQQIVDNSNRLNSEHKRYKTYCMDYKKKIIQEVK